MGKIKSCACPVCGEKMERKTWVEIGTAEVDIKGGFGSTAKGDVRAEGYVCKNNDCKAVIPIGLNK